MLSPRDDRDVVHALDDLKGVVGRETGVQEHPLEVRAPFEDLDEASRGGRLAELAGGVVVRLEDERAEVVLWVQAPPVA